MPGGDQERPRLQFFVYIVESPSAPDLYHGRSEGALVQSAVNLDNISAVVRTAINLDAFGAALSIDLRGAMGLYSEKFPILHVSAHGGRDGIQLSSGDTVHWAELRKLLIPINQSLGGVLLLCMSACEGYNACRMAMEVGDGPHPYLAMVGNYGNPSWSDTAVAYASFYHLLARGYTVPEAVKGMRAASGDIQWVEESADESKRAYLEYLRTAELVQARADLEVASQATVLSPEAKALERPTHDRPSGPGKHIQNMVGAVDSERVERAGDGEQ